MRYLIYARRNFQRTYSSSISSFSTHLASNHLRPTTPLMAEQKLALSKQTHRTILRNSFRFHLVFFSAAEVDWKHFWFIIVFVLLMYPFLTSLGAQSLAQKKRLATYQIVAEKCHQRKAKKRRASFIKPEPKLT